MQMHKIPFRKYIEITDEKLKDFFKDYKVEITWTNILTGQNKKIYYLKDYFQ